MAGFKRFNSYIYFNDTGMLVDTHGSSLRDFAAIKTSWGMGYIFPDSVKLYTETDPSELPLGWRHDPKLSANPPCYIWSINNTGEMRELLSHFTIESVSLTRYCDPAEALESKSWNLTSTDCGVEMDSSQPWESPELLFCGDESDLRYRLITKLVADGWLYLLKKNENTYRILKRHSAMELFRTHGEDLFPDGVIAYEKAFIVDPVIT